MDFRLASDDYKEFREALLGPALTTEELLNQVKAHIGPLAKSLNIGYIEIKLVAPISPLAQDSSDGKFVVYYDSEKLPNIPSCTDISEVMTTAENGTFTFNAQAIDNHTLTEEERKGLQLIAYDCFILGGRARLMGMADRARTTDYQTGAINQAGLKRFIEQLMESRSFVGHTGIFVNLKNFKYINKSMSPQVGDLALKAYVNSAKKALGEGETIARLGGDNFFFIIKNDNVSKIVSQFSALDVNLSQGPKPLNFTIYARMGIYIVHDRDTMSELMNNSSIALNVAKSIKTADIVHFSNEMLVNMLHQREVSTEFHNALLNNEFIVYYQPKVDLTTKELIGSEALVRWLRHKTIVPPLDFLPILEREGSVCQLDFYVLDHVCRDLREWIDRGITPVRTSTNFSKLHLKNPNFADDVLAVLNRHNIEHRYIEIELTEVSDYEDYTAMQKFVNTMRSHGVYVSIDDFGTGYSTLNIIKDFDFNVVKLDKSLLDNVGNAGSHDEIVVRNVIRMAKEMNKEVIAEGVESETQAKFLTDVDCQQVQGFLFDKPLKREDFEKRLTSVKPY